MKFAQFCLLTAITILSGCTFVSEEPASDRQAEVAAKGTEVMPFDLEQTTPVFEITVNGGRQQVVADNPGVAILVL